VKVTRSVVHQQIYCLFFNLENKTSLPTKILENKKKESNISGKTKREK
jgi:hypothetical protein